MYHPTRGGVRGGRDQFSWDDVKVDKHRENYLGHSLKAPVGRWQKGKDLHWYTRDKKTESSGMDTVKEEVKRIKEQEEQAMREALGLAPKCSSRPQGNRLDKHELSELVKRGSTADDLGEGHSEAAWVHGLGFSRAPRPWEDSSTLKSSQKEVSPEMVKVAMPPPPSTRNTEEDESEDERSRKKRKHEEKKKEKHENHNRHEKYERREKHERREKRHSRDSDDKRKHRKDKEKRRHDSD